ncbi:MAG TPA: tetratricopeptide repeat protein [Verrucomicrobiae bacterium]|nr:tetratricopeptide repeat protein [Verrucomicrobiae bacterium]
MPEKKLNEISRPLREQYDKGIAALQRNNLDYAIAILEQVLVQEPAFYDCREALRAVQLKKSGGGGGFFKKMLGAAGNSPQLAKGQLALRSNPLEAIKIAEQMLNGDPNNASAHRLLAEGALAADLPRTAVLSLEIVMKNSPGDRDAALKLARALSRSGQVQRGENILAELLQVYPNDQEISQALKDISARRTLKEGGYGALEGGQGSYRDILKNKSEAVSLEQENKSIKSEDMADRLIREYEARIPVEPGNLKLIRSIAELHTQKKNYDKAIEYYQRIMSTEGAADSTIEKAITDLTVKKYDEQIAALDPNSADYAEQSARLQTEKQTFLVQDAQRRVERYPTDLQLRFELGVMYFHANRIGEAIQELQKAQGNPHKRIQALSYLGQCFAKRNMNDLAARTLQNAIKEKLAFDDEKKDLVYALGSVLEKMGKKEEAIEHFKQIYESDIGYKDVAAKVDAYYASLG